MELTKSEYLGIMLDRAESLTKIHTDFILKLLITGKIFVEDIPAKIRISDKSIYITAFRIARGNSETLNETLRLLGNDIEHMERAEQVEEFMSLFADYEAEVQTGFGHRPPGQNF